MFLLLWISLLCSVIDGLRAESCTPDGFKKCAENAGSLQDLDFGSTTEEFEENCEKILPTVNCMRNYVKTCMTYTEAAMFNTTTGGTLRILEGICTDGTELNTGHLKNLQCWPKTKADVKYCESKFAESQNNINGDVSLQPRMRVFHSCCSFDWFKMCKRTSVELKCNEEAKSYMDMLSTMQEGDALQRSCALISSGPFENCFELYGVPNTKKEDLLTIFCDGCQLPSRGSIAGNASFFIYILSLVLIRIKNY